MDLFGNIGSDFDWEKVGLPLVASLSPLFFINTTVYLVYVMDAINDPMAYVGCDAPRWVKQFERMWNVLSSGFAATVFMGCAVHFSSWWHGDASAGFRFWCFLFAMTKPMEYVDTYILMLKNRTPSTLHWTHHFLTAAFCWWAAWCVHYHPVLGLFVMTNSFVHIWMYAYYFFVSFSALRDFLRAVSMWLTRVQMLQFVVCLTGIVTWVGEHYQTFSNGERIFWGLAFAMYLYYLVMFSRLKPAAARRPLQDDTTPIKIKVWYRAFCFDAPVVGVCA